MYYAWRIRRQGISYALPLSYGKSHPEAESKWQLKAHSAGTNCFTMGKSSVSIPGSPCWLLKEKRPRMRLKSFWKEITSSLRGSVAPGLPNAANWALLANRDVVIWPDNDAAGLKASTDISHCLKRVGVNSLKVVTEDILKDLPQKWDLADPLPEGKGANFIQNSILRAESKAIGVGRLESMASQYKISPKELNEVVCSIDDRLRPDLEKKFGTKTWEIENAILGETSKLLQERRPAPGLAYMHDKIDNHIDQSPTKAKSVENIYE